ncbi:cytochrome P450 [Bradyrhizobium sp. 930_D9_N1_4]|uniref:cytochrome P450 n=1 Tax=Bradyrhizobium sp. 930_D9_N1_4 TaxID=3240374 RepID=UPI003F88E5C5
MAIEFDPRDPSTIADPFPILEHLRSEDPVHWCSGWQGWLVTRYADVKAGLRDTRLSANRARPTQEALEDSPLYYKFQDLWFIFNDPPEHTRRRALVSKAFTSRVLEGFTPAVASIVDELVDRVIEAGQMDLLADFAEPLPRLVVAEQLGLPRSDIPRLKEWTDHINGFVLSNRRTSDKRKIATAAIEEADRYFRRQLSLRRHHPRHDLLTALVAAEDRGSVLSEDELVATSILILVAGNETVTHFFGNGMLALLSNEQEFNRLRGNPGSIDQAVEELLRYDPPQPIDSRIATEEIVLHGRTIHAGDRVTFSLSSANRDAEQFSKPNELDLGRQDNPHLAFGYGAHFCLAAPMARLQARIGLSTLVRRLAGVELRGDPIAWKDDSFGVRGVRELGLNFQPSRSQTLDDKSACSQLR